MYLHSIVESTQSFSVVLLFKRVVVDLQCDNFIYILIGFVSAYRQEKSCTNITYVIGYKFVENGGCAYLFPRNCYSDITINADQNELKF